MHKNVNIITIIYIYITYMHVYMVLINNFIIFFP